MRQFGQICLLLAFVGTGYSAVATLLGWYVQRPRILRGGLWAGIASTAALSVAMSVLLYGLLSKDFRFQYVAQYSNRLLPWHYSIASLWVGQAGSMLLWSWLSAVTALLFRGSYARFAGGPSLRDPTFSILMAFCWFLITIMVFAVDPMAPSIVAADDGVGLSPILQHPAMLIHPPIVFLSYALWTVPFALAMAALITRQLSATWTRLARPWALMAWAVLAVGILLGANWAYRELGWGGYWAWDPVENGSLIPWLFGTSAIHTLMAWRHRGMFKKSALAITIATFGMCNFATFLTRSGIFSSLHAFSQSPIGWSFLGLMILILLAATGLIWHRHRELRSERRIASFWCRESMVALSTLAIVSLALIVCAGTVSAAVSNIVVGQTIVLGVAFYNNALIPIGITVLLATAAAPLLRWGSAPSPTQIRMLVHSALLATAIAILTLLSGIRQPAWIIVYGLATFSVATLASSLVIDARRFSGSLPSGLLWACRNHRRQYAGFVIHMGVFCLAIGVTASSLGSQRRDVTLQPGQSVRWAGHRIELLEIVQRELHDKLIVESRLKIQHGDSKPRIQSPAQHYHHHWKEWTTETSVAGSWLADFYTILHSQGDDGVRLTLVVNPMIRWIWWGGGIMAAGSLIALWPTRSKQRDTRTIAFSQSELGQPLTTVVQSASTSNIP